MNGIGQRIEERRVQIGLSKTDIWKAAKKTSGAYTGWLNGSDPDTEAIFRIANVLRVTAESLVTGKNWPEELNNKVKSNFNIDLPLLNIYGSMGNGHEIESQEVVIDVLRISKSWADKNFWNVSDISNLAFIHAIGDSMMPTFNDGDILLVDTGNKIIDANKIYVLEAHGRLHIKRITQRMDGGFEVTSDNPSIRTVEHLNGDHEIVVKGRIIWVWNGKRV